MATFTGDFCPWGMKFEPFTSILGLAAFGIRLAQMKASRVWAGVVPRSPQRFRVVPSIGWGKDDRNCVSGKAMDRSPNNMDVPPARRPTGLPKNREAAAVARLAVCPATAAVDPATGL